LAWDWWPVAEWKPLRTLAARGRRVKASFAYVVPGQVLEVRNAGDRIESRRTVWITMGAAGGVLAVIGALLIAIGTGWAGIPLLGLGAGLAVGNLTFIVLSRKMMGKRADATGDCAGD
jgi:hypothetical protein